VGLLVLVGVGSTGGLEVVGDDGVVTGGWLDVGSGDEDEVGVGDSLVSLGAEVSVTSEDVGVGSIS
jgi:hypothetical protein